MSTTTPTRATLVSLTRAAAAAHALDSALVCAICEQESSWNPWAIRYEPAFFTRYIAPMLTVPGNAYSSPSCGPRGMDLPIGNPKTALQENAAPENISVAQSFSSAAFESAVGSNVPSPHTVPAAQHQLSAGNHSPAKLSPTEARARAFSWGLMQVMGQVAREQNFVGPSFAELCDPAIGLEIGCRVLESKLRAAHGDVPRALQLWNGGANPSYATEVLARLPEYL